jgi:hypothetical protein
MIIAPASALTCSLGASATVALANDGECLISIRITKRYRAGVHVFAVAVQRDPDKGQSLAAVLMD